MAVLLGCAVSASADITIVHVYGETRPLEAHASRSYEALMLGLEYAPVGGMEIDDEAIIAIKKDIQFTPDAAIET